MGVFSFGLYFGLFVLILICCGVGLGGFVAWLICGLVYCLLGLMFAEFDILLIADNLG